MDLLMVLASLVVGAALAALATWQGLRRRAQLRLEQAKVEAGSILSVAARDAAATAHLLESTAREQALEAKERTEQELGPRTQKLAQNKERQTQRNQDVDRALNEVAQTLNELKDSEAAIQVAKDEAIRERSQITDLQQGYVQALEQSAGVTAADLRAHMARAWSDEVRSECQNRLRLIDQNKQDPEVGREAKRLMDIAMQRYHAHFLTERLLSNVAITPEVAESLARNENRLILAMHEVTGVNLDLQETGERIRLDSGDGVAREVCRRVLGKLQKGSAPRGAQENPQQWIKQIQENLAREIITLGKKAFKELEIPPAHPEIVELVGKLNYRTSYTQNQWKHAMEAAYLGGMMASELGLDVKICRRATLMHDIGKSLTHEIDGSHAVIGADYARRLGETELVANAIGAHHADEPPNSIYAYLVAACDALSGARPGARREQTENYSTRLDDMERIGNGFRHVDRAFAIQGGRELRVYVRHEKMDDLAAVNLSQEIATKVSEDLTFPGQIKVTVIRRFEAVQIAS